MRRALLVLMVALLALVGSSVGLAQNLGPGIRWGPPSGMVPISGVGVPTSQWTAPPTPTPVASYPTGDGLLFALSTSGFTYPHPTLGAPYGQWNAATGQQFTTSSASESAGYVQFGGVNSYAWAAASPAVATITWTYVARLKQSTDLSSPTGVLVVLLSTILPSAPGEAVVALGASGSLNFDQVTYGGNQFSPSQRAGSDLTEHVFAVRGDGTNLDFFVDGVKESSASGSPTLSASVWYVLGERFTGTYPALSSDGRSVDHRYGYKSAYLYSRALTDAEITGSLW